MSTAQHATLLCWLCLTLQVAYRVHACVSRGLFYPEKLVDNLLAELRSTPEHLLAPALEHLLKLRPPLKEPLLTLKKCVKLVESSAKSEAAVPDYCAKVCSFARKQTQCIDSWLGAADIYV